MSISADEVNYLIYRYLHENGFSHTAFTFAYESLVAKSAIAYTDVPPGALVTFLQKGLEYVGIEEHINEVSMIFYQSFSGQLLRATLNLFILQRNANQPIPFIFTKIIANGYVTTILLTR
jgi:hypothetical protein